MIRHDKLLDAVKVILDADSTLRALLKTQGSDSKIIIGISRETIAEPWLSVAVSTHNVNNGYDLIIFSVIIHALKIQPGQYDQETLSNIADQVQNALEGQHNSLSIENSKADYLSLVEVTPAADEGDDGCFQALRFQLNAKRRS